MNKKLLTRLISSVAGVIFSILFIVSCNSDDDEFSDFTNPEISSFMTNISTAPGLEFNFKGEITDETGIKSISISYEDWFLDKVIVLNHNPKNYSLDYKFLAPENAIFGSSHTIKVDITDLGGNTVSTDVLVTLNLDVNNPVLEFISPFAGSFFIVGDMMEININVSDDLELDYLWITSELLNLDDIIDFSDGETLYNYSNQIEVPEGLEGPVLIEAIATDKQGNEKTASVIISVGSDIEYANVYLTGGSVWYPWDPTKATKMWQDPNDGNWFTTEFYYRTNDGIKFIGQLGLAPYNWGLNPNDSSQIINSENSEAINLPDGDGYYRIKFNPYSLEYTYETMTVDIDERNEMYLMGKGFVGYNLNWNPADAIPMVQDTSNPYVFSIEVDFSEEVNLKYIGQNDGWGPYDCGFVTGGEQQLPLNYVKGILGDGTPDAKFIAQPGSYRITFDYFLLRTTVQPSE